ncbi:phosphoadenosine phosphosulfate reductase [Acidimangrovimonas pyrenivorans]|uniref:Phosphoadenosine phosphosulfate reductase n=1 Tax=Acidimangrovimonas pyrenivorans TaxID=2030798 RepID=A0ABV7AHR6_9RHOB
MKDIRDMDAAETTTKADWLSRLAEIGDELGYFERLGDKHSAFFVDDGATLVVSFESLGAIRGGSDSQMPLGYSVARAQGWSHLCLIADGETWYRDPAVYGYFDRLVDDAFFEDFDRVVFFGSGMGAYGATAYSVAAPGATVVAIQPVATLDPAVCEWDERFREQRRLCFTDRYGFAPDMIEGAGEVFVIYDPEVMLDAMQAALFTKPYVTKLRCRNLGEAIGPSLQHMKVLVPLLTQAGEGRLNASAFYQLYRARRDNGPYLRNLLSRTDSLRRPMLSALLCRNVLARMNAPRFRRRLSELTEELEALGIDLPAPLRTASDRDPVA